jgi:hypothetical protein
MRKKAIVIALALGLAAGLDSYAAGGPAGLTGIGIFGSAGSTGGGAAGGLGLTLKWGSFPVVGLKYDFSAQAMDLSCDYYVIDAEPIGKGFSYFLGAGAYLGLSSGDGMAVGLRIPAGIQYWPVKKFELFLSPVLTVPVFPSIRVGLGAELGLRVHF